MIPLLTVRMIFPARNMYFKRKVLICCLYSSICKVHLEQAKKIVSQQHQLKDGFTRALFFRVLVQKDWSRRLSNDHIILGFFDVIFSVVAFFICNNYFF